MADYLTVLDRIHQTLRPRTYLEIGTQKGESFRLARCASLAIDPSFDLSDNIPQGKPKCLMYQCSSDSFFRDNDPVTVLGDRVDLAFLDGMHLFEFLLRDFINTERCCRPNSIIALHDTIPGNLRMAERNPRFGEAWTGDVWKTILILKQARPDLKIVALDAPPTGLVLVTNLDPGTSRLSEDYFDLVETYRSLTLEEFGLGNYVEALAVRDSDSFTSVESFAGHFWL